MGQVARSSEDREGMSCTKKEKQHELGKQHDYVIIIKMKKYATDDWHKYLKHQNNEINHREEGSEWVNISKSQNIPI